MTVAEYKQRVHNAEIHAAFVGLDHADIACVSGVKIEDVHRVMGSVYELLERNLEREFARAIQQSDPAHGRHP